VAESVPFSILAPRGQYGNFWIYPVYTHTQIKTFYNALICKDTNYMWSAQLSRVG